MKCGCIARGLLANAMSSLMGLIVVQPLLLCEQPPVPPKPIEDCVQQTNFNVPDLDAHSWTAIEAGALKGASLLGVRTPSANNIVISGTYRSGAQLHSGGFLLRSSDGGSHWLMANTAVLMYDIEFRDPNHGIAMGDNGIVLTTFDGGKTWARSESGQHVCSFMGPFAYSGEETVAFGFDYSHCDPSPYLQRPFIARSANDGGSWRIKNLPPDIPSAFTRLVRIDSTTLVALAGFYGVVGESSDDGESWQFHSLTQPSKVIFLIDAVKLGSLAVLAGSLSQGNIPPTGVVVRREQGTWVPHPVNILFRGLSVTPSLTLYAIGNGGIVGKSEDGGEHWSQNSVSPNTPLSGIAFESNSNGYIVGSNGLILKTTDSGATWFSIGNKQ